jgi:hypothetical protein
MDGGPLMSSPIYAALVAESGSDQALLAEVAR